MINAVSSDNIDKLLALIEASKSSNELKLEGRKCTVLREDRQGSVECTYCKVLVGRARYEIRVGVLTVRIHDLALHMLKHHPSMAGEKTGMVLMLLFIVDG